MTCREAHIEKALSMSTQSLPSVSILYTVYNCEVYPRRPRSRIAHLVPRVWMNCRRLPFHWVHIPTPWKSREWLSWETGWVGEIESNWVVSFDSQRAFHPCITAAGEFVTCFVVVCRNSFVAGRRRMKRNGWEEWERKSGHGRTESTSCCRVATQDKSSVQCESDENRERHATVEWKSWKSIIFPIHTFYTNRRRQGWSNVVREMQSRLRHSVVQWKVRTGETIGANL